MSFLIGVSGASSSGKTTVAITLRDLFPGSVLIHQDDFYFPDEDIPFDEDLKEYDWDCPEAVNFDKLISVLHKFKESESYQFTESSKEDPNSSLKVDSVCEAELKQLVGNTKLPRIVFVDGFLLYHNQKILDLLDICLFYKTDYKTLKHRREVRKYTIDAGIWTDPPGYFDKIVWPQYYKNHAQLFENAPENEQQLKDNTAKLVNPKIKTFDNNDSTDFNQLMLNTVTFICNNLSL
ncbi:hypothetical protein OGAPHI_002532 [Ogataea philodendri]|uniref:Phosphoribulokinase/uridine kinase domain-containing protein n=1 Tax=Ogataea philodendri TaxID=1378263 RepID=A0A9P8PB71_9ASCO|nr:uncharacterized protein OGAPHI_002532 [Ogataea philodendri]KAH3668777.1 hypothetical protein OGAPHI_002532 [Ogataea philodendri]